MFSKKLYFIACKLITLYLLHGEAEVLNEMTDKDFSVVMNSFIIESIVETFNKTSLRDCIRNCGFILSCKSINYNIKTKICELCNDDFNTGKLKELSKDWFHLESDPYRQCQGRYCCSKKKCSKYQYCKSTEKYPFHRCLEKPCKNSGTHEIINTGLKCYCPWYSIGIHCESIKTILISSSTSSPNVYHFNQQTVPIKEITTCFWFKYHGGNDFPHIFGLYSDKCTINQYLILLIKGRLIFRLVNAWFDANSEYMFQIKTTYHVCLLWKKENAILYVNGAKEKLNVLSNRVSHFEAAKAVLGQDLDNNICSVNEVNQSFMGSIGLLNTWKTFLEEDDILDIYHGVLPKKNSILIGWDTFWQFREWNGVKKSLLDISRLH